jgi:hypothetical protein
MLLLYLTDETTKISLNLFFKRVFSVPRFNLTANIVLGIVAGWTIAGFTVRTNPTRSCDILTDSRFKL